MKWKKRIEAAERSGGFTESDEFDATWWASCAVGELKVATGEHGCPLDLKLKKLGSSFYRAIYEQSIVDTWKVYNKIHAYVKNNKGNKEGNNRGLS